HGAVGAQEAEEADEEARGKRGLAVGARAELADGGRGEGEGGLLAESDGVLGDVLARADAGLLGVRALQAPDGLEEVEVEGALPQRLDYSRCLMPTLAGHRMISPRSADLMTVSVNEFILTYLAKNSSRTAPRAKTPVPSKAGSSSVTATSRPRAKAMGP